MTWYCNSDLILKELKMKGWLEKKTVELFNQSNAMTCDRVKAIRRSYRMTQEDFATVLNISFHTYKNWEIGHRNPCTSAVSLLTLAEQNPKLFLKQQECG